MMEKIKYKGTVVGYIPDASIVYISERSPAKHFMRKYQGYGVSRQVLRYLEQKGVQYILIRIPNDRDYLFTIGQYLTSSLRYHDGDDTQLFVSIDNAIS